MRAWLPLLAMLPRVAAADSPFDGDWLMEAPPPPPVLLSLTGDRLSRSSLGGYGYDAVIGGPPVPVRGDVPAARIQVAMPDARAIVERLSLKPVTVVTPMALQPDARTIRVTGERLADHSRFGWTMHKR